MQDELQKLRIDKEHKASRDESARWPWLAGVIILLIGGIALWQWRTASAAPVLETIRVRVPEPGAVNDADLVMLNATGYVMAAHKIELASKVVGRVAWVGVEMGDKIAKDQVLVRLEDDEFKARVAQAQGQLDHAKAQLAELLAGSRAEEVATAQARLDQAQAELTNAELSYNRLKEVEDTRVVSKQQLDDAEGALRSRRAQVETQRQQFELVKAGPRKEQSRRSAPPSASSTACSRRR